MPQAKPNSLGHVVERLDIRTLHVDDPDRNVHPLGDFSDQLDLGELAAGHFDVDLVDMEIEKIRKHGTVPPRGDRSGLKIAEAEMGREPALADDRLDRAVEDLDQPLAVLAMGVAA